MVNYAKPSIRSARFTSAYALRNTLVVLLILTAFVVETEAASSTGIPITNYSGVFNSWLPIIIISVLVSTSIVSIYYAIGSLLNNKRIKTEAIYEFAQAIGTVVIVIIIMVILNLYGTTLSLTSVLSPSTVNSMCTNLYNDQLAFINANPNSEAFNSGPSPTAAICANIIAPLAAGTASGTTASGSTTDSLTTSIDYGLAASYVIFANLTSQSTSNYNAFYIFSDVVGFLSKFTSVTAISTPTFDISFDYTPLAGYSFLSTMLTGVGVVSALSFYAYMIQMLAILLILFIWPYLLAAGIILRASAFTRRIGGLFIGLTLSFLIIMPLIILFEYASLSSPQNAYPIGTNTIPYLPIYEQGPAGNVMVYGASSGFVNAEVYAQQGGTAKLPATCAYVYESFCGDANSIGTQPICAASVNPLQLCQNGYILANTLPQNPCQQGQYVYEGVCGDPNTTERQTVFVKEPRGSAIEEEPACFDRGSFPSDELCRTDEPHTSIAPFMLPNATKMLEYYSCWPIGGNIYAYELIGALPYLIPFYGLALGVFSAFGFSVGGLVAQIPTVLLAQGCTPQNAINAGLTLTNIYGVTAITAFILPLLNILIIYSGAMGISRLMGGDTDVLGLSKLI